VCESSLTEFTKWRWGLKYCPKPLPVYFNAFSMGQQLFVPVQYIIKEFNNRVVVPYQFTEVLHMYPLGIGRNSECG